MAEQGTCECPRCGRLHHKLANKPLEAIAGPSLLREPVTLKPQPVRFEDALRRVKDRIDTRLNNHLCDMREGYDDSIVGFNEAWDIVRAIFAEELKP